jgi:rhodanese-related sulfurtransferase
MKKLLVLSLASLFFVASCKKVEDEPSGSSSDFETMTNYMVDNNLDLTDILSGWIVPAPDLASVQTFIDSYDIIDIRNAQDFGTSHIEGAVNSSLANILTAAANTTKPILVVCYTGQAAGHAVVALKLSGYDAKVLQWGMSGWRADLADSWEDKIGDVGIGHTNWVSTPTADLESFGDPDLSASGDGAAMLAARVQLMLDNGFKGVENTAVLNTPSNYFINLFWDQADVDTYGHIAEAYRIKPLSLSVGEINNLDPDKTVVTYCWTGQTSSVITAYLNVIGYDARSLTFGSNGMIYSNLTGHKFTTPTVDLPVVN